MMSIRSLPLLTPQFSCHATIAVRKHNMGLLFQMSAGACHPYQAPVWHLVQTGEEQMRFLASGLGMSLTKIAWQKLYKHSTH